MWKILLNICEINIVIKIVFIFLITGDGFKQVRVGQLQTSFGGINISVAYRTKMTISPTQAGHHDNAIMLKSDHFLKDISPKHTRYNKKM